MLNHRYRETTHTQRNCVYRRLNITFYRFQVCGGLPLKIKFIRVIKIPKLYLRVKCDYLGEYFREQNEIIRVKSLANDKVNFYQYHYIELPPIYNLGNWKTCFHPFLFLFQNT